MSTEADSEIHAAVAEFPSGFERAADEAFEGQKSRQARSSSPDGVRVGEDQ